MKNNISYLKCIFLLLPFFTCCQSSKEEPNNSLSNYALIVKDSILVQRVGSLALRDRNQYREEYLFSLGQTHEIIITNRKGDILYSFNPTGEGDKECGKDFLSVGYFNENSVVVLSKRGYFFYTLDGKFIRKIEDPTPIARTGGRIKTITINGDTCLISLFKHYFDPQKYDNMLYKKEYYEQVRLFTLYNLSKKKSDLIIGYEPNGFYRQFKHFYVSTITPQISFNSDDSHFYVLLNPDNNIYVYDTRDSIKLSSTIPIQADYFKLPFLQPFRTQKSATEFEDALKSAALNGSLDGFSVKGDTLLVVYSSGIDESKAKDINSITELNELTNSKKSYIQVYIKEEKVSKDIEIPNYLYRIAVFNNSQNIIMQTDFSAITERPNYSVFFICGLQKITN